MQFTSKTLLTATIFTVFTFGCGGDQAATSATTSQDSSSTSSTGTTDEPTTDVPTTSLDPTTTSSGTTEESISSSATDDESSTDSETMGTTGGLACHLTCQDVFEISNFYDPSDYNVVVCEDYENKALNYAEMVEQMVLSERFGALCKPFDQTLHSTSLNVSKLAELTGTQENMVRCIEFLGYKPMDIPPDMGQTACMEDAKQLRDFLEGLKAYQTQHKIPDELTPNQNIYQTVAEVQVGNLEDLFVQEFAMGTDTGAFAPQQCRLRMDNITAWGTETFVTEDQPFDFSIMTFQVPNQSVVKRGYNVFAVECILTSEQIGWGFCTNPILDDTKSLDHNLHDSTACHEVVGP